MKVKFDDRIEVMKMTIRVATIEDTQIVAKLAIQMWKSHTIEELEKEFRDCMSKESSVVFLAMSDECVVGFAQCGLRCDYVEGTDSSPVGYLKGIFVKEEYRKRGLARDMLEACQKWAKEQGCREFASDCELDNEDSLRFHLKMGFEEANRIICFTKKLTDSIIGRTVTVTIDRPLGSYHPKHKDIFYPINYGYIEGIMAADGEEQDAYILGVDKALEKFTGKIIAIVHRKNDVEEKWVVAPEGMTFTKEAIREQIHFQEQYFDSEIVM